VRTDGTSRARSGMATRTSDDATATPTRSITWARLRFTAGMTILSAVFVISHGLVLVHELTQGETEHPSV
jgi:hypothetical protein